MERQMKPGQKEWSQYKSLAEWRKADSIAYQKAWSKGLVDRLCECYGWIKKTPNGYWTLNKCKQEAFKYKTRTEWRINSGSSYKRALENNWLNECCKHMTQDYKIKGYRTFDKCKEVALKFNSKIEFMNTSPAFYKACYINGWLDELCKHMIVKTKSHSLESIKKTSLLCKTKKEFYKKFPSEYDWCLRNKKTKEICSHMLSKKTNHTIESIKPKIILCKKRYEFKKKFRNEYAWLQRNNLLHELVFNT